MREAAQAAKALRTELKVAYPMIKFSVTSDNFAGGNSIRCEYEDGPMYDKIEAIASKYQYGEFNGMEDIYENNNRIEGIPQVKYVTVNRNMSKDTREGIFNELKAQYPSFEEGEHSEEWGGSSYSAMRGLFKNREYGIPEEAKPSMQHVVEYYVNDFLVKSTILSDVVDAGKYWADFKNRFTSDNGFVTIAEHTIVSKCSRGYDYMINKLTTI